MNSLIKRFIPNVIPLILILVAPEAYSQILINEICSSNINSILNDDGDNNDWIEICNAGSNAVNLGGYGLSDEISKPYKFTFPPMNINPGQRVLVFASGREGNQTGTRWETAVHAGNTWRYFVGNSQPDTNWRNLSFDDSGWLSGPGGIGYDDNDDATVIPNCLSVMMRKSFIIPDTSDIHDAIFNIDYDDGFVAYLNGVEIARANVGNPGDRPAFNVLASSSHEARMYNGQLPDSFYIDAWTLKNIIVPGNNVLAVQVHNRSASSDDLSAIPFLSFGMLSAVNTFSPVPSWFRIPAGGYLQADFKLSKSGDELLLTDDLGLTIDQVIVPELLPNHSFGRSSDGSSTFCVFRSPTPLSSNSGSTCYPGYVASPVFSLAPGKYTSTQTVTLSCSTPGAVIRYTTNGNEPVGTSPQYNGPITVNKTRILKARAFKSGYLDSPVITNSYFINENHRLPVFTVSTDSLNLWDWNTGIYVMGPNASSTHPYKGANFWQDWEKPAVIEYYDKNWNRQFHFNADIEIYGNYSQAKPQKSFEVKLSKEKGMSELEYSLWPDKPFITKTDNFILRNAGSDWNKAHFRDAFMERVMRPTHSGYLSTDLAIVYLNGDYWGVYSIHENHDQHWVKNNYGYEKNEIDMMLIGSDVEVKFGDDIAYNELVNYAKSQNPNSSTFYSNIDSKLDLKNFTDYFIAETYWNNLDWMGSYTNNIKSWRPRVGDDRKVRFLLYDLDMGCAYSGSSSSTNTLSIAVNPQSKNSASDILQSILNNSTYKTYFINRYADLINTIFQPSKVTPIMNQFKDSMNYDMPRHFDTWPSFRNDTYSMSTWNSVMNSMNSFISARPGNVRGHIQSQFNLNKQVTLTLNVSPAGAGRILISTIVPESYPWSGVYFQGNPVTITAIPNPGYSFDRWRSNVVINSNDRNQTTTYNFTSTDQITAYFTGSPQTPGISISEFNYHSSDVNDAGDWIELHNYGNIDIDISQWKIQDDEDYHKFIFPVNTVIRAGEYLVVAEDLSKFRNIHPSVNNVTGPLGFSLSNSGELIRLSDHADVVRVSFTYNDRSPWPVSADGEGYTCELLDPNANLNDGSNWFAGCAGGSPGRAFSAPNASFSSNGVDYFCSGSSLTLQAVTGSGYEYQWYRNMNPVSGADQATYEADQPGSYSLAVSSQGCTIISSSLVVTELQTGTLPQINDTLKCGPGSLDLHATSNDTIYWYDATVTNLLSVGNYYTTPALNHGIIYYLQTGKRCPGPLKELVIDVYSYPRDPFAQSVSHCGEGSLMLTANSHDPVYWYDAPSGNLLGAGNTFSIPHLTSSTVFYCVAGDVCQSNFVPVHAIILSEPFVNLGPDTSILSGQNIVLDAGAGFRSYLWSTGASTQTITANSDGLYSVTVEDRNGCIAYDDILISILSSANELSNMNGAFRAFPVPASGQLSILLPDSKNEDGILELFASDGRLMKLQSVLETENKKKLDWDIRDFPSGIYFLKYSDSQNKMSIKIPIR